MEHNFFDLDFSRWEVYLISLIPSLINIAVFLYSFLILNRSRLTGYFSAFVLFLALWQAADGLMKLARTAETAMEWNRLAGIFVLFLIPTGIQFLLYFSGWAKGKLQRVVKVLLFFPVLIFLVLIEGRFDKYNIVKSDSIYWIANPEPTFTTLSIFIWLVLGAFAMLAIVWLNYYRARKKSVESNQALLLSLGFTFPVMGGIIFEIFYPLVFNINDIPVTTPLLSIFSITSMIAIKKYKMLEYSPRHHWDHIVESMNEGILIVDNDDRIHYANKAFCNLLGYEFEEIKEKVACDILMDEDAKKLIQKALGERKKMKTGQYEITLRTKAGEKVCMLVSGSPYIDAKGNVIGSIGIHTNITYLKETESKLEHNEKRLNQAQQVAHVGSWELNFATGKSTWSDEACRMYGISPSQNQELSVENWMNFIHPEDLPAVMEQVEKSKRELSDSSFKHRIVLKDGTVRHIHSMSKFEFNSQGYPIGLFGVCHDITEQVEAQKALIESEENIRTFINESLMSIYFVDPKTKEIVYSNPALSDLLGYSKEDFKTITPSDFVTHTKEDIESRTEEVDRKKISTGERQWKTKDGRIVHVLVSSFYHKRNGTDTIYVAAQDITERKKAEEKLKLTNDELTTFIYKASHDIRGPLASVLGLVNVSKLELKEPASIKYLDMIGMATQKLDYSLGELVKAMRIKDVEEFSEEVDFKALTGDLLKKFSHFPGYCSMEITTAFNVSEIFYSNRSIIETIMQNLIENAIKYQKATGERPFLKITVTGDKNNVTLVIADNGSGIEKSIQGQVYDMYFRGNETTKGSGLGLYLVKKGVDKLSGDIQLKSQIGVGTTFTVNLPGKPQVLQLKCA